VVGERKTELVACNRAAVDRMAHCRRELAVVAGADSLIEDPRDIDRVAGLARDWFVRHLGGR
jgi:putative phosphoribosyl transferase